MLPVKDLKKIIPSFQLVEEKVFKEAQLQSKRSKTSLEVFLLAQNILSEEVLYKAAAKFYDVPFQKFKKIPIAPSILNMIPENIAEKYQMVPFKLDGGILSVVTSLPPNLQILEFLERKDDIKIKIIFSLPSSVHSVLGQYRKDIEAELEKLDLSGKEVNVVDFVEGIIGNAIKEGVSDVHIEPKEHKTLVRYRKDGILHDVISMPKEMHPGVVTRIKIMANLRVDEHRLPQDGRINMSGPGFKVSLRVSIMPVMGGEKVVLRILHQDQQFVSLEKLGLQARAKKLVDTALEQTQGMTLVVGPTGSGKTTTLYTLLQKINDPGINISTIEDPIEYSLEDINQSQVKPDIEFTFAAGLRSFLRQDPDVIMVGEIRDEETAEIALHAALTGHLVFSTLHTNDAPSTLPRLLEMGIPPYLIASTVNIVVAQRLVRQICSQCAKVTPMTQDHQNQIETEFGVKVNDLVANFASDIKELTMSKGVGCEICSNSGMKGRIGIFEVMEIIPEIYTSILNKSADKEMYAIAKKNGMMTLAEDGVLKILQGTTTFEELLRVL